MPKPRTPDRTVAPGRVVLFQIPRGHPRWGEVVPSIITEVVDAPSGLVHLQAFLNSVDAPLPPAATMNVPRHEDPKSGTWRWPA